VLVSAIVVNLNERELLGACLESLEQALAAIDGQAEVLVVDNGSCDGAQAMVHARFPRVRLIELGENRGFAAGINEGLRASAGEWLLLLNNDTTIAPDAAVELLAAGSRSPEVGSLAAQMRFARGGAINSAGFGVDRLGIAFDRHIGERPEAGETAITEVFGACAGAALMRRAMLADVGGFDESFFMYLDDVDLAWRAQMRGWRCLYVPAAVVHHHHSASSGHGSAFKHDHVGRNRVRLLAKNMPSAHLLRYGPAILAYDAAFVTFAAITDRTLAPLRGRWSGVRDWRAYRARGRDRQPVALSPVQGPARALARRRGVREAHVDGDRRATTMS
jgi:GT2 family glycosyltransferase